MLIACAIVGQRASTFERVWLAGFLAGMPLVYVASWVVRGGGTGWLAIELLAVPAYGVLAILGLKRPLLLAIGIAAHGLLWDAWHLASTPVIPRWYAGACLAADVAIAVYFGLRISARAAATAIGAKDAGQ